MPEPTRRFPAGCKLQRCTKRASAPGRKVCGFVSCWSKPLSDYPRQGHNKSLDRVTDKDFLVVKAIRFKRIWRAQARPSSNSVQLTRLARGSIRPSSDADRAHQLEARVRQREFCLEGLCDVFDIR